MSRPDGAVFGGEGRVARGADSGAGAAFSSSNFLGAGAAAAGGSAATGSASTSVSCSPATAFAASPLTGAFVSVFGAAVSAGCVVLVLVFFGATILTYP